jgi:predicted phosphodiesterase
MVTPADEHRLVIVSDSHLAPSALEANSNWAAVVDLVGDSSPDLVLHLGDLSLDAVSDGKELTHARALLDDLPTPWLAIPGNHDVGDNPDVGRGPPIRADLLDRWRQEIGPDWWTREIGGWSLVAVNAQLFQSDLPAASEQWEWLEGQLDSLPPDRPVVFLSHKPLAAEPLELSTAPTYRFVPNPARDRLTELLDGHQVPLVLSGHVHQFRILDDRQRRHVWAPTSWAVYPDRNQARIGLKRCGVLCVCLEPDAETSVEMIEPSGLEQFTVGPIAH